jgi:IclR family acetate operon transcriptional repressor
LIATRIAKHRLASLDNALRLLLLFAERPLLRVTEVGAELGIGRSTAHRILTTLEHRGFVRQDHTTRRYRLGPSAIQIARAYLGDSELRRHARPHLEALCAAVGETTHLLVLDHTSTIFVDSAESDQPLRTTSRIGQVLPAHATSGGKALLAELSSKELRRLYPRERLPKVTDRTITSRRALERELAQIRERGYATNIEESEADINAVAVTIPESSNPPAAIATSGPTSRFTGERLERVAQAVREAAEAVAATIGPPKLP